MLFETARFGNKSPCLLNLNYLKLGRLYAIEKLITTKFNRKFCLLKPLVMDHCNWIPCNGYPFPSTLQSSSSFLDQMSRHQIFASVNSKTLQASSKKNYAARSSFKIAKPLSLEIHIWSKKLEVLVCLQTLFDSRKNPSKTRGNYPAARLKCPLHLLNEFTIPADPCLPTLKNLKLNRPVCLQIET